MALAQGTKLGPYEIQSPLGAGGMGEVYRARDTRLDRIVAIKVLASHLSASAELRQRMEREARAISSLNHACICQLYDIGSQDGTEYLVMEFLEGETLADRLRRGPLPLAEALKIATAVAEALAVAHERGIVHRDLKPGNIMLTKGGTKLMDFGLAKTSAAPAGGAGGSAPLLSAAATMTAGSPMSPLTTAGAVLGTIQYMAPEQIEGKEADARSDLFAFGAVLYEMLAGKRPFQGKSQITVASAILEQTPEPLETLQPNLPAGVLHVVNTCLEKNPEERFQNARDVALELKWIAKGGSEAKKDGGEVSSGSARLAWAVAGALGLLLVAAALWWISSRPQAETSYYAAPLPFEARDVAIAPNGHTVVVVGHPESQRANTMWLYEPGAQDATQVPNTEGANFPFWSADGRSLGFFADGKLKRVDLAGGPVQTLCDAPSGRGGTWNKNGDILFTPSGLLGIGLYRIAASGGTPSQILAPDHKLNEDSVRWASFLPDGVHFIYSGVNLTGKEDLYAIYEGALNSTEKHLLVRSRGNAMYAEPGILVFYKDRTLFAQDFDWRRGELKGESRPIYSNVDFSPRIAKGSYSVSGSGLLLAQKAGEAGSSQLVWFDRKGHELGVVAKQGIYGNVTLSRDGKFVASDAMDINNLNTDIYTFDVESGESKRVTFDPAIDSLPAWSPDGKQVVFANNGQSRFDLYLKNVDGSQAEKQIAQDGPDRFPVDWSRDGKYILYERGSDLWYLRTADMTAKELLKAPSTIRSSQFSPDGKWVAYSSNETGKWEVFVTSFPDGHGKWQISNAGGNQPRWRGDSREMYYMTSDSKLVAVPAKSGASFEAGAGTVLFQAYPREAAFATSEQYFYDVSRDGQKFLINAQIRSAMAPLSVVHGWNLELKK